MASRFLFLATQGGSSESGSAVAGPLMLLFVIALVVLAVCVGVLTRFARRRLIDEPTARKPTEFADPWTEAGRRIGGSKQPRPSTDPPPPGGASEDESE